MNCHNFSVDCVTRVPKKAPYMFDDLMTTLTLCDILSSDYLRNTNGRFRLRRKLIPKKAPKGETPFHLLNTKRISMRRNKNKGEAPALFFSPRSPTLFFGVSSSTCTWQSKIKRGTPPQFGALLPGLRRKIWDMQRLPTANRMLLSHKVSLNASIPVLQVKKLKSQVR